MLFIECTHTYHSSVQSGIQRVVRNIMRNAEEVAARHGYNLVAVVFEDGQFREADLDKVLYDKLNAKAGAGSPAICDAKSRWSRLRAAKTPRALALAVLLPLYHRLRNAISFLLPFPAVQRFLFAPQTHFGLTWCLMQPLGLLRQTSFVVANPAILKDGFGASLDAANDHRGNILLLLDSSWDLYFWPAVERFQAAGGTTQTVIYDLIPITHPGTVVRSLRDRYSVWMTEHLRVSRRFLAISHSTAAELDDYIAQMATQETNPKPWSIVPFYLGSELDLIDPTRLARPHIQAMFTGHDHVFIVVGSIEPRKNHGLILDAFDRRWAAGSTARLVIVGRHGWKTEALTARIERHRLLGQRLFLVRDMADSELSYAYGHASALVIASEAEGFGLPVVEAFQRGLPVLCSDIAVFREIASGRATFFGLDTPQKLADAVSDFCATHDPSLRTERHPQPWLTWMESTEQLLGAVLSPTLPPLILRLAASAKVKTGGELPTR